MNQCDGCASGWPIKQGIHFKDGRAEMACQKSKYKTLDFTHGEPEENVSPNTTVEDYPYPPNAPPVCEECE